MKRSILLLSILTASAVAAAGTELGIDGKQFTVNGKPTFLLGISYYGVLGASRDFIRRDLDDMQKYGFNWFRVWATWGERSITKSRLLTHKEGRVSLIWPGFNGW